MSYLGNAPTTGHFPVQTDLAGNGSTRTFTLDRAPATAGAIEVSIQGVLQPTTAYSVSGTTLTMAGVTSGIPIFIRYLGETLSLPTPADGSVTDVKIADMSATKLTGTIAGARFPSTYPAGDGSALTNITHIPANDSVGLNQLAPSVDGNIISFDTAGDTLYYNPAPTRLAKGTAAQVLTMNAGATAPEWAAAGGGTWIPLQEVEANNSSTSITFTEPAFNATYTNYVIIFNKLNAATANAQPRYEFYSGSWLSANYRWAHFGYDANNNERKDSNQGVATIGDLDGWGIEGGSAHGLNGIIHCWNPLAAVQPTFHMALSGMSYTGYFKVSQGVLANGTTGAVTNMRFSLSTGNIETGEFRLYGIKDA